MYISVHITCICLYVKKISVDIDVETKSIYKNINKINEHKYKLQISTTDL